MPGSVPSTAGKNSSDRIIRRTEVPLGMGTLYPEPIGYEVTVARDLLTHRVGISPAGLVLQAHSATSLVLLACPLGATHGFLPGGLGAPSLSLLGRSRKHRALLLACRHQLAFIQRRPHLSSVGPGEGPT